MTILNLCDGNSLFHVYHPPANSDGKTFVFFNALTGDLDMWEGNIGEALRAVGHGTLSFNFRGQRDSDFTPDVTLTPSQIVADAARVMGHVQPPRPVMVGLSIGGLFAAQLHLGGTPGSRADAIVLINTLRIDGPRLRWINEAVVRGAEVGGVELFKDLFLPVLFGEKWLGENRGDYLKDDPYTPLDQDTGTYQLLKHASEADWNVPYEKLDMPVLVMTGLQDHVFYEADAVNSLSARLPNATRLDIPDAGHLLPVEAPATFSQELLDFIAGI